MADSGNSPRFLRSIIGILFRRLSDRHSSATLDRLGHSRHLRDLRSYARTVMYIMAGTFAAVMYMATAPSSSVTTYINTHIFSNAEASKSSVGMSTEDGEKNKKDKDGGGINKFHFLAAVFGVGGSLLAWIYRNAAIRLGVVDLFGAEIATICRVGTVIDIARRQITLYHEPETAGWVDPATAEQNGGPGKAWETPRFASEENYFTVFSSNSKDLEVLDAYVVNVVTSFYTYIKAVRDYLRRVGQLSHRWNLPASIREWKETWKNTIYMEFLSFEAARKVVKALIEYEPSHVENTTTILITEITLYGFLLQAYNKDDVHYRRLALRHPGYEEQSKDLQDKMLEYLEARKRRQRAGKGVDTQLDRDWAKVFGLWDELRNRLADIGGMNRAYSQK